MNLSVLRDFPLSSVLLRDEYGINAYRQDMQYLFRIDENRLLAGFYENAGIKTPYLRYNGWENSLIAGHTLGHYLTALAQGYANPLTDGEDKQRVLAKLNRILSALEECQTHSKGKKGFLWGAVSPKRGSVEQQFDNVEKNKTDIVKQAWVPWYTMHKLIAGLVSVYNLTPLSSARGVLGALCDWVYDRVSRWDKKTRETVLSIEYGGMNDCLYSAYRVTGKREHALAAHVFDEEPLFEKVLSGKQNALNDLHANTTIPKFLGALNRYLTLKDDETLCPKEEAERYLSYAEAFFDTIVQKHAYITGDVSEWEHFGKDKILDAERTQYNCETCAAYNMLLLARELFRVTKEKKYADYYERTYINSILAAQNPETGMAMYFQPMAAGFFKVFSTPFDSFWCCTGTGMEDFTKLGDSIYFYEDEALYVNSFFSSSLFWQEKNAVLTQRSSLLQDKTTRFCFDREVTCTLHIRIPDWSQGAPRVFVGGTEKDCPAENGYLVIEGTFRAEEEIVVSLPFGIRAATLPDNHDALALSYGPLVLCARLSSERMDVGTTGVDVSVPKRAILSSKAIVCLEMTKDQFRQNPEKYLRQDGLSFTLQGCDKAYTFVPYYSEYKERYGIYWILKDFRDGYHEDKGEREIIDTVQPGYGQYENDALHAMKERKSVGCTSDGTYRYAKAGGFFTYRMKAESGQENILIFTLRKEDSGKSLQVKIKRDLLYRATLPRGETRDSYEVKIKIPDTIVQKHAKKINAVGETCLVLPVTFSSADKRDSARVCDFIYIAHETK